MDNAIYIAVIGAIGGGLASLVGTVVAARYGLLGKRQESTPNIIAEIAKRLSAVEDKEHLCQQELFDMRQELSVYFLATELMLEKCPEADDDVRRMMQRVTDRYKQRKAT